MMKYTNFTKTQLIEICKKNNIKSKDYKNKTKDELISIIKMNTIIGKKEVLALNKSRKIRNYLDSIIGHSSNKYKIVNISPLRYAGGKSRAIGWLLENLPFIKNKKVISPFFGGGSFELVLLQLGYEVIGYDVFNMLVNFWRRLKYNSTGFVEELSKLKPNKTNFTRNRHILLNYWEKIKPEDLHYETRKKIELTADESILLDDSKLLQAVYYYYNTQLSYGPMFCGWNSSLYLHKHKFKKIINKLKDIGENELLDNLTIRCESFENIIPKYNNEFLFLDPPYYLGDDSSVFKGIYPNSNFPIHHKNFNHRLLRNLLKNHKGGFLLTYNDCPKIRKWYKQYKQVFPAWQYTFSLGEIRIGKNRRAGNGTNMKVSSEIIIVSFPFNY